ncbi:MAG: histidine phosphatase family protein [Patescibacteria group bacterium]
MKLVLVRHGKSINNALGVVSGRSQDKLTREGIRQAEEVAKTLDTDFDIIFSSVLRRAKQTAGIINRRLKLPIETRLDLNERDYGVLTGQNWDAISALVGPDAKERDRGLRYNYGPWGGEWVVEVRDRVLSFLNDLIVRRRKKYIAVTHGGIIMLMYNVTGKPLPAKIPNCSVHEFEI